MVQIYLQAATSAADLRLETKKQIQNQDSGVREWSKWIDLAILCRKPIFRVNWTNSGPTGQFRAKWISNSSPMASVSAACRQKVACRIPASGTGGRAYLDIHGILPGFRQAWTGGRAGLPEFRQPEFIPGFSGTHLWIPWNLLSQPPFTRAGGQDDVSSIQTPSKNHVTNHFSIYCALHDCQWASSP